MANLGELLKRNSEIKQMIEETAYIENPVNRPVIDGPINPEAFLGNTNSRVVFITQEPYGNNGGFDLSASLNKYESLKEQPKPGYPTFSGEVKITNALTDCNAAPDSKEAYNNYKHKVAHVNVKKEPNTTGSKADDKIVAQHAAKNTELLQKQIDNLGLTKKDNLYVVKSTGVVKDSGNSVECFGYKYNKRCSVTRSYESGGRKYQITKYENGKNPTLYTGYHPQYATRNNIFFNAFNAVKNSSNIFIIIAKYGKIIFSTLLIILLLLFLYVIFKYNKTVDKQIEYQSTNTKIIVPIDSLSEISSKHTILIDKVAIYNFDTDIINTYNEPKLKECIEMCKSDSTLSIVIYGYTCDIGDENYNQKLSERRAASIERIIKNHYPFMDGRTKIIGLGEILPDSIKSTNRSLNRRVDIIIQ